MDKTPPKDAPGGEGSREALPVALQSPWCNELPCCNDPPGCNELGWCNAIPFGAPLRPVATTPGWLPAQGCSPGSRGDYNSRRPPRASHVAAPGRQRGGGWELESAAGGAAGGPGGRRRGPAGSGAGGRCRPARAGGRASAAMHPAAAVALVFGGCCSNVVFLELLARCALRGAGVALQWGRDCGCNRVGVAMGQRLGLQRGWGCNGVAIGLGLQWGRDWGCNGAEIGVAIGLGLQWGGDCGCNRAGVAMGQGLGLQQGRDWGWGRGRGCNEGGRGGEHPAEPLLGFEPGPESSRDAPGLCRSPEVSPHRSPGLAAAGVPHPWLGPASRCQPRLAPSAAGRAARAPRTTAPPGLLHTWRGTACWDSCPPGRGHVLAPVLQRGR